MEEGGRDSVKWAQDTKALACNFSSQTKLDYMTTE